MKDLPLLSRSSCARLACALAFLVGLSLPALADSHHFGKQHALISMAQNQVKH